MTDIWIDASWERNGRNQRHWSVAGSSSCSALADSTRLDLTTSKLITRPHRQLCLVAQIDTAHGPQPIQINSPPNKNEETPYQRQTALSNDFYTLRLSKMKRSVSLKSSFCPHFCHFYLLRIIRGNNLRRLITWFLNAVFSVLWFYVRNWKLKPFNINL